MGLVVCGPRLENVPPPCQDCIFECAKTREGGQGSVRSPCLLFCAFGFLEPDLHNAARTAVAVADLLSKGASSIALAGFPAQGRLVKNGYMLYDGALSPTYTEGEDPVNEYQWSGVHSQGYDPEFQVRHQLRFAAFWGPMNI